LHNVWDIVGLQFEDCLRMSKITKPSILKAILPIDAINKALVQTMGLPLPTLEL
jgi:hypothetical protein